VTEGKLAVKLVAKGEGVPTWEGMQSFRQLQETLGLASPGALLPAVAKHLRAGPYSIADVAAAAGAEPTALFEGDGKKAGALKVRGGLIGVVDGHRGRLTAYEAVASSAVRSRLATPRSHAHSPAAHRFLFCQ
jgi:hypothetical protein